jgi:hypothetical protein
MSDLTKGFRVVTRHKNFLAFQEHLKYSQNSKSGEQGSLTNSLRGYNDSFQRHEISCSNVNYCDLKILKIILKTKLV